MDMALDAHLPQFTILLQDGSTDAYWEQLWTLVEHSILNFTNRSQHADASSFLGRGTSHVRETTINLFSPMSSRVTIPTKPLPLP